MKQKLLNNFKLRAVMLVAILCAGFTSAWADEVVAYTLTPASGSNNSYANNCDITISNIIWNLTGNSTYQPWRIGGKSLSGVDRTLYSKTAIADNVSKIEVTHGAASSITVNSWTVIVASDANFTNVVSTLTPTFAANSTTTITRPEGKDWSNCYYKFVYNVSVTGTSNKFLEFSKAEFYKESGSSDPIQLSAPELAATANNGSVTLEWDEISNASSYTIQYADNASFTGATTVTDATSPKEISGLTNGTTYYFKAMTVGDGTNYLSSDYGDAVSATPANVSKITITQDKLTDFTNTYAWYDWTAGGVSGSAYAYKNSGMQFNSSKDGYWIYNTTAIPGTITSVKMVKASGTDRSWTLKAGTSEIASTNDGEEIGEAQTVGTSGATWNVNGSYNYFCLIVSGGSTVISSIEITYIPSTDPIIVASDPSELAYDATGGEFEYSITNPTSATLSATSDAAWITNVTVDGTNSKVTFVTTANPNTTQRTGTITLSYEGATDKNVTITQAAAPVIYSTIPALFDAATSTETEVNVNFGGWVISAVNGSNAYLTDNQGHGLIIYKSGHGFQVNDELTGTVNCKLKLYNGSAEFTNLTTSTEGLTVTSNGTVTAQTIAISELSGVNTGALLSFEGLTYNGTALVDGNDNAITPYTTLYAGTFENGKSYNVSGIYLQYNNTKEILPRSVDDIEEVVVTTPTITLASYSVEATANTGLSGTINVTYDNITTVASDIAFYESDGTTTATYDWITVTINSSDNNVEYLMDENNGAARTAYFKVWAYDDNMNEVYSNLVTVTQAAYVVDYAELPFSYDENGTGNLPAGLTVSGLGTYSNSPRIKFDSANDYLELKIQGGVPAVLKFDIKGNGSGSDPQSGTFKVQVSTDGTDYEDLAEYKSLSSTTETKTLGIEENIHYIKWIYSVKSVGNVALGNINLSAESIIVGQAGYTTYTTMNNVSFPENVTAYIATQVNANTIHMETIESAPARTPVVIKAAEGSYTLTSGTSTADVSSNILKSSDGTVTGNESSIYALGKKNDVLGFYLVENGQTVPAGKAYLNVNNGSNVKGFTFDFGTETGIQSINNEQLTIDNDKAIFNLAGQRMSKMQKGINIVNGKKVLVK